MMTKLEIWICSWINLIVSIICILTLTKINLNWTLSYSLMCVTRPKNKEKDK